MAGIYIHIPFCRKACHYCNFHFSTSLKLKNDFIVALLKEIKIRKDYIGEETIETVYFGGGTPSLLLPQELECILLALKQQYRIAETAEVTLEANPDDIDDARLAAWQQMGINRLSIGVQSFFDEDLQWMNRIHHAGKAAESVEKAQQYGFYNISIDLIFGVPGLTDERWEQNIAQAIALNIPHLSCYALTVEPRTALQKMIAQKKKDDVIPDDQARQFLLLMERLTEAGYEQYEISNFSKPGFRSRHNSSYWQGSTYLGLGPSAHSFNGSSRQWNIANNALYIQHMGIGTPSSETEVLSTEQQLNEYVMISLRTIEGIDLDRLSRQFSSSDTARVLELSEKYARQGKIKIDQGRIRLTPEGRLFADGIAADLFV
jgi:oxygen-independent coproporphyrinogen-3 oxidase